MRVCLDGGVLATISYGSLLGFSGSDSIADDGQTTDRGCQARPAVAKADATALRALSSLNGRSACPWRSVTCAQPSRRARSRFHALLGAYIDRSTVEHPCR